MGDEARDVVAFVGEDERFGGATVVKSFPGTEDAGLALLGESGVSDSPLPSCGASASPIGFTGVYVHLPPVAFVVPVSSLLLFDTSSFFSLPGLFTGEGERLCG